MLESIMGQVRNLATKIAAPLATPAAIEDSPNEIYAQIRPLLTKLSLTEDINRPKTQLVPGQAQGNNKLYQLYIRRTSVITPDIIARLNRNRSFVNLLKWNQESMELQLWWPYNPPGQIPTQTGVTPAVTPTTPI